MLFAFIPKAYNKQSGIHKLLMLVDGFAGEEWRTPKLIKCGYKYCDKEFFAVGELKNFINS
jgi:hypothetical protein|tara:strand:+ start:1062 stop:1244 length:183 start_codon:yes stop_codon:yes gene_type:complete